jgi:hypothetical protein
MPEAADPFVSVGYLTGAAVVTVVGLVGYALLVTRRYLDVRERNATLRAQVGGLPDRSS